jgi:hypothetical protein
LPAQTENLFPKPVKHLSKSGPWFCDKAVLGKNSLANMMSLISVRAGLSRKYTNHCIRATVVCELKNRDVTVEDIQLVTGHKRRDSVERYVKRVSDTKKKRLSDILSDTMKVILCKVSLGLKDIYINIDSIHTEHLFIIFMQRQHQAHYPLHLTKNNSASRVFVRICEKN